MNTLKSVSQTDSELRVGNYIVLFGGKDLTGEFFTQKTNFHSNYTDIGLLYVDFEHGRDAEKAGNSSANVLGVVDWSSAKTDSTGIFVERVLNRRADYVRMLEPLLNAGIMGTSSEAVPGRISKKSGGEIVDWPLMRDSLTVTPMEPRMVTSNVLTAAKSLAELFPTSKSLAQLAGVPVEPPAFSLKSIEILESLRDAEKFLRDVGLGQLEAKALIARVKSLGQRDVAEDEIKAVVEALKRRAAFMA